MSNEQKQKQKQQKQKQKVDRAAQIAQRMADESNIPDGSIDPTVAIEVLTSYAVHLEVRVADLEAAMGNLLKSLMEANKPFEDSVIKPQGIILP